MLTLNLWTERKACSSDSATALEVMGAGETGFAAERDLGGFVPLANDMLNTKAHRTESAKTIHGLRPFRSRPIGLPASGQKDASPACIWPQ
jgi:hypothetical protein